MPRRFIDMTPNDHVGLDQRADHGAALATLAAAKSNWRQQGGSLRNYAWVLTRVPTLPLVLSAGAGAAPPLPSWSPSLSVGAIAAACGAIDCGIGACGAIEDMDTVFSMRLDEIRRGKLTNDSPRYLTASGANTLVPDLSNLWGAVHRSCAGRYHQGLPPRMAKLHGCG